MGWPGGARDGGLEQGWRACAWGGQAADQPLTLLPLCSHQEHHSPELQGHLGDREAPASLPAHALGDRVCPRVQRECPAPACT